MHNHCGGCLCDCTLAQTRLVQCSFIVVSLSKQMRDTDAANVRTDPCNSLKKLPHIILQQALAIANLTTLNALPVLMLKQVKIENL